MLARKPAFWSLYCNYYLLKSWYWKWELLIYTVSRYSYQLYQTSTGITDLSAVSGTRLSKASPISIMAWTHCCLSHCGGLQNITIINIQAAAVQSRSGCAAVELCCGQATRDHAAGNSFRFACDVSHCQHTTHCNSSAVCHHIKSYENSDSAIWNVIWNCVFRLEASVGWSESNQLSNTPTCTVGVL